MKKLTILTTPHPILRKIAKEVPTDHIAKYRDWIEMLSETMYRDNGIGIAAPQVGESIRIIIIAQAEKPLTLINPVIIKSSEATELGEEGCLSVPGIFGLVRRSKKIKVSALNQNGKKLRFDASHLFARVILHEIDHLNGILFIDKLERETRGDKVLL